MMYPHFAVFFKNVGKKPFDMANPLFKRFCEKCKYKLRNVGESFGKGEIGSELIEWECDENSDMFKPDDQSNCN